MNRWVVSLIEFVFRWWLGKAKRQALFQARKKGVKAYLHLLQGVRVSAIGLITALIILQFIGIGLAMMVGAGIFLSPLEMETKLWIAFGVGCGLFLIPVIGLCVLLSQRLWYKVSGAQSMVNELLKTE